MENGKKKIVFCGSENPTIGVEVELQILNAETLDLCPRAEEILKLCDESKLDRVKTEVHQSMLEIDSGITSTVKECYQIFKNKLTLLDRIANRLGLLISTTGTHPFQNWFERIITKSDRYQFLHKKFQWLIQRMNIYATHVHIGVCNGNQAIAVASRMRKYLPHLLALSGNSPYWHGVDTGMESCRISFLESFPYAHCPIEMGNWADFEDYYMTLHRVGAIDSVKDLYWHVRPNLSFGTVEVRVCDAISNLDDFMAVVALIQCLVVRITENFEKKIDPKWRWILPENQWVAARDGLEGVIIKNIQGERMKISDDIFRLVEELTPIASRLDCMQELMRIKSIIAKGTGAQKQRAIFSDTHSLVEVVKGMHQEFTSTFSAKAD